MLDVYFLDNTTILAFTIFACSGHGVLGAWCAWCMVCLMPNQLSNATFTRLCAMMSY